MTEQLYLFAESEEQHYAQNPTPADPAENTRLETNNRLMAAYLRYCGHKIVNVYYDEDNLIRYSMEGSNIKQDEQDFIHSEKQVPITRLMINYQMLNGAEIEFLHSKEAD